MSISTQEPSSQHLQQVMALCDELLAVARKATNGTVAINALMSAYLNATEQYGFMHLVPRDMAAATQFAQAVVAAHGSTPAPQSLH